MNDHGLIDRRTARGIYMVAAATTVAPFVVQTATLVLTGSTAWTLVAGVLLALLFAWGALVFQARQVGGWNWLAMGSAVGIVLAVFAYHAIAFPVAHMIDAMFFSGATA